MSGIESWSTTPANNNQSPPFGWPAGILPSQVEPIGRQMMTSLAAWYQAAEWINYNFTPTYVNATQFTLPGNVTPTFHVGRRVQATDGSTSVYGTITVSAFTTLTTVTVVWDSGVLQTGVTIVYVGIISKVNPSTPTPSFINAAGNWTIAAATTGITATVNANAANEGLTVQGATSGLASAAFITFRDSAGARLGYVGNAGNAGGPATLASDNAGIRLIAAAGFSPQASIDAGASFTDLGWRDMPQIAIAAPYTLVLTDRGKHIFNNATAGANVTIPANASVAFPIGTVITVVNNAASSITIGITTDTLVFGGVAGGSVGTRTLANAGVATLLKVTTTAWYITGVGLT